MAHELIHAQHTHDGTRGTGSTNRIKNEEIKCVRGENQIRDELGEPRRTHYSGRRDDRWRALDGCRDGTSRWCIEQGLEMGRPSLIEIEADKTNGVISAVRAGGAAVMVSEGMIEIPDVG